MTSAHLDAGHPCAVDILTRPEDVRRLEPDWERLWASGGRREIFNSFAWTRAFLNTYGDRNLFVAVARRDGRASAILPMRLEHGDLRLVGMPHADYGDVICDPDTTWADLRRLIEAVMEAAPDSRRLRVENLSERSRFLKIFGRADFRLGLPHTVRRAHRCPGIMADDNAAGVFGGLAAKENPKRCEKRLKELGPLAFAHIESRGEALAMLDTLFDQHRLRRALATGSAGMFAEENHRSFFRALVGEFDPSGPLRFAALRLGDRPVALHLGFELDRRYLWYVPAFDVDFWNERPGLVLLRRLFEYAAERRLREFDFSIGDEDYKNRFANYVAQNYELTVFPRTAGGYARLGRERVKRWAHARRRTARAVSRIRAFQRAVRRRGLRAVLTRQARELSRAVRHEDLFEVLACASGPGGAAARPESVPLSALVRRSLEDPAFTRPDAALERMRAGHVAIAVRSGDELTAVLWTAPPGIETAGWPPPPNPGYLVYDLAPACGPDRDDVSASIARIGARAAGENVPAWVCCAEEADTLRAAAVRAGCRMELRVRCRSFFGRRQPPVHEPLV